ncbi:MAG TPA: type II toxin-antitoxin system VapC family toxin [Longimicrobium sp.]
MRYYYFDASVLVKAYLWETGPDDVRQVLRDTRAAPPRAHVATSSLAFVEVASAVSRRDRAGEISHEEANGIRDRLRNDFESALVPYSLVKPRQVVLGRAAALTRAHRLRALDALHLATGIGFRSETPAEASFHFASADRRLSIAALSESFDVFDPQSPVPPGTGSPVAPAE